MTAKESAKLIRACNLALAKLDPASDEASMLRDALAGSEVKPKKKKLDPYAFLIEGQRAVAEYTLNAARTQSWFVTRDDSSLFCLYCDKWITPAQKAEPCFVGFALDVGALARSEYDAHRDSYMLLHRGCRLNLTKRFEAYRAEIANEWRAECATFKVSDLTMCRCGHQAIAHEDEVTSTSCKVASCDCNHFNYRNELEAEVQA